MDLSDSRKETEFRLKARSWLEQNRPAGIADRGFALPIDPESIRILRDWQRRLYDAGYLGISWPAEYGGQGKTIIESAIFNEEMARLRAPAPLNEPGSGSDLAALGTRATLDGDRFVVNGQKLWTSLGHIADWCMLLVRTDANAPKHRGISYLLVDMHSSGITVQPLKQMTGEAEFNQIFFEDVRVPRANLLGPLN